jgi:hypothetical protein
MIAPFALSFALSSEAAQPSPRASEQNRETGRANQQPTNGSRGSYYDPVVVEIKPTPPTNYDAKKESEQKEERASDRQWVRGVAFVTGLTALLQLILLWRQTQVMDAQNTIMERQSTIMRDQLVATGQSASAAARTAETASNALYVAESAAIHFAAVTMKRDLALPNATYAIVRWRNFGRTRATDVVLGAQLQTVATVTWIDEKRTVLKPDQELEVWSESFADLHLAEGVDGVRTRSIRLSGTLVYTDIFDRRLLLRFDGSWIPKTEEFEWIYYKTGIINMDGHDQG